MRKFLLLFGIFIFAGLMMTMTSCASYDGYGNGTYVRKSKHTCNSAQGRAKKKRYDSIQYR